MYACLCLQSDLNSLVTTKNTAESIIWWYKCTLSVINMIQWLETGRWLSLGTLVSSTNKIDRHDIANAVLTLGHIGQLPGGSTIIGAMLIYACCVRHVFLMFKHWFCWRYQYNKYMFNVINIYSCITVSSCVGRSLSVLLCLGA